MFLLEIVGIIALVLLGITWVAMEMYGVSLASAGALIAFLIFVFSPVKKWIATVGWKLIFIKWLPIYLAIGVVIAFMKWFFYVWRTADHIRDARESFKDSNHTAITDPADRRKTFVNYYVKKRFGYRSDHKDYVYVESVADHRWKEDSIVADLLTPRAKKHVDRISFWVLEWPYVIVATIIDDILIKFAHNVARFFDWAFTNMSKFWISRVVKDI